MNRQSIIYSYKIFKLENELSCFESCSTKPQFLNNLQEIRGDSKINVNTQKPRTSTCTNPYNMDRLVKFPKKSREESPLLRSPILLYKLKTRKINDWEKLQLLNYKTDSYIFWSFEKLKHAHPYRSSSLVRSS